MTTTYLGFLMNRSNREEFVAPVAAEDDLEARRELYKAYPESRYALLTVYTQTELEHVLAGVARWPGLPNKVQEPLEARSAPVRVNAGKLPPLPGQVQARVEAMETIEQAALPGWMQSFVQAQAVKAPAATQPAPRPAVQPMAQMMAEQRPAAAPQSLIERLKMARGDSVGVPVRREAVAVPEAEDIPITRTAGGPSVIDILKGMRK